jgi:hypothetical protein
VGVVGGKGVEFHHREPEEQGAKSIHRKGAEAKRKTKIGSPQRPSGHREKPIHGDVKAVGGVFRGVLRTQTKTFAKLTPR